MATRGHACLYLAQDEVRFLDAAVARLIPADELGPGAREAGVTDYIDRQLAGTWGAHGRSYRQGPWAEGTPQQGYQSPLAPKDVYRVAIRETNDHCAALHGKVFHVLDAALQDKMLAGLEQGAIELPTVSSRLFFQLLWRNTEEGFFADPIYGGNRDKIGWRLLGFPGVAAGDYATRMQQHNVPYRVEPVGIQDVVDHQDLVDAAGYPRHIMMPIER